ncbi:MAG: ATP-binding protein [Deltaproteobacteria bacterium]|nr:ATP-binding protein [Deltaproteobacteria bacterium]
MFTRTLTVHHDKSFFLFGPRGTGKSTWIRTQLAPALTLDLLEAETWQRLLARPGDLEQLVLAAPPGPVVIDEVQRAPELLNEVHRLIEGRGTVFALTGSSARKLRRNGVNLLAGRALTYRMFPLTAAELGTAFDLQKSLQFGHLPAIGREPDPERFLHSYVQTYLREEVQQEGLTRNLSAFSRFLEALSFSHAAQLNITDVARECAVDRKTVEGFVGILEDLLLAVRLPPFTRRATRRLALHPKLFFFDVGVFRTLRPKGPLDRPAEIAGAALEGLVWQELRAVNDLHNLGYTLHFWRTATGHEVDFVLYGERGLHAIEVKHSGAVRPADLVGLQAFCTDYPEATATLLYMGERPEQHGNVAVLPVAQALPRLAELLGSEAGRLV